MELFLLTIIGGIVILVVGRCLHDVIVQFARRVRREYRRKRPGAPKSTPEGRVADPDYEP